MAWVKRNLIFVIIIALGLAGAGYGGYLLYGVININRGLVADYSSTIDQVKQLKESTPAPTAENIEAATADQERVREFLRTFKKAFAPFPTAKSVDDRGFLEHLALVEREFSAEATNSGVQTPPDYYFSFSGEKSKLTFSPDCLDPLMQEIEEIRLILRVLCDAKINYLENLQRIPACQDDNSGEDILFTSSISNQWGLVTPYKVTFRGFSTEVASVLMGFASSSNCFVVKYLDVRPSQAPLPQVVEEQTTPQQQAYIPPSEYAPPMMDDGQGEGRRFRRYRRPQPQQLMPIQPVEPTGPAPPVTILRETPLYVTIVVDVVKLKAPEPEPTKKPAAGGGRQRQRPRSQ